MFVFPLGCFIEVADLCFSNIIIPNLLIIHFFLDILLKIFKCICITINNNDI